MAKAKTTSTENGHIVFLDDRSGNQELNSDNQSILSAGSVRRKDKESLSRIIMSKPVWWYGTGLAVLLSVGAAWWIVRKRNIPLAMTSNLDSLMD